MVCKLRNEAPLLSVTLDSSFYGLSLRVLVR